MATLRIFVIIIGFNTAVHLQARVAATRVIMPAALLNAILLAAPLLADRSIPQPVQSVDALHVLFMAAVGGAVYVLCFLYLPIPALASETTRWKVRLKLARAPA